MNAVQQKYGIQLTQVEGLAEWFLVEYVDGTATIHETWDDAMTAGNFDTNE